LLDPTTVVWESLVRSTFRVDCSSLSDPALVREDGGYLCTLTSVVDDVEMKISHVIRGEDHVTNTGLQIQGTRRASARAYLWPSQSADRGEWARPFKALRGLIARRVARGRD
jgi:hypothetical protein